MFGFDYWKGRSHDLGRMSLGQLLRTYITYPSIVVYLTLGVAAAVAAAMTATAVWPVLGSVAGAIAGYVIAEYSLHRYVLHGRYLYKNRFTASLWKRIHFDHHQDPHDLRVLFGAISNLLPAVLIVSAPIGYAIGQVPGMFAAMATGLFAACIYEFCHCVQHLKHTPRNRHLQNIKRRHLAHHFHNEQANFGITTNVIDRLVGTFYDRPKEVPRSPTTFNLGYTAEEAERYPWVKDLSGGERRDSGPQSARQEADEKGGRDARTAA